jgi:formiminoglutamase
VSAPAPLGIDPKTVRSITEHVVMLENFLSFDVSEVNPTLDVAEKTTRLIGYVVAEIMMHLNKITSQKSVSL